MMQWHLRFLPHLLLAFIVLAQGAFLFYRTPRSPTYRTLASFFVLLGTWLLFLAGINLCGTSSGSFFMVRMGWSIFCFLPIALLDFNLKFIKQRKPVYAWSAVWLVGMLCAFAGWHGPVFFTMNDHVWGSFPQVGSIFPFLFLGLFSLWIISLGVLYGEIIRKKKRNDFLGVNQLQYVFLAESGFIFLVLDLPAYMGGHFYPIGSVIIVGFSLLLARAILRYRTLPDIYFLKRRMAIASVFVFVSCGIFLCAMGLEDVLSTYYFEAPKGALWAGVAILLAGGMRVLFDHLKNTVDRLFFPEYNNRKKVLRQVCDELNRSQNSHAFNRMLLTSLYDMFGALRVALFVIDQESKQYVLTASTGWGISQIFVEQNCCIQKDHPLFHSLINKKYISFYDLQPTIGENLEDRLEALWMLENGSTLIAPIFKKDVITGLIVLGDKESGLPYSSEDIATLMAFSHQAGPSLERVYLVKNADPFHAQQKYISDVLPRYVHPTLADEILKSSLTSRSWRGEQRMSAIVLAALSGFTEISRTHPPQEMAEFLNGFFSEMTKVIDRFGGTIDKFMGESLLVIFGVPNPQEDFEVVAAACAIEMQAALRAYNAGRAARKLWTLGMSIGISSGEIVAGRIGSKDRVECLVMGEAINTAARVQQLAKSGQIYASDTILKKIAGKISLRRLPPIYSKEKNTNFKLIEIIGYQKV